MSRHRIHQDNRSTNRDKRSKKSTRKSKQQPPNQSYRLVAPTVAFTLALTAPTVLAAEKEVLTAPEVVDEEGQHVAGGEPDHGDGDPARVDRCKVHEGPSAA